MRSSQSENRATSDQSEKLLTATLPVRLDREQLWEELLRKAESPVQFIPGIVGCTVLERRPDGLLREIVLADGHSQRERVLFTPPDLIEFDQVTDPLLTRITNEITGDDQRVSLTLTVELSPEGLARGPEFVAGTREYFAGTLASIVDTLHGENR